MLSIIMFLIITGAVALTGTVVVSSYKDKKDGRRKALKTAEATLRRIANGSGNPVLEAQIALDEIDGHIYNTKELN